MIRENERRRPGRPPKKSATPLEDDAGRLHDPPSSIGSYIDKEYPELRVTSTLRQIGMQLAPAAAGEVLLESMRAQDFSEEAVAQMRALMFTLIARHAHAQVRSHDVTAWCAILLDGRLETETEEEVARSLLPVFEQAGFEATGIRGIAERLIAQCRVLDPFDDVLRNGDLT